MDYKSTRLIERFILSAVSSSFVIIVLNILNSVLLKNQILDFVLVNFFTYASIIGFSFIYSAGMDFFVTTKSRTLPHIVILISCIILMLILSFMFQQYDAPYALIPAMIVLYIISAQLNSIFLYHDVFLESISRRLSPQPKKTTNIAFWTWLYCFCKSSGRKNSGCKAFSFYNSNYNHLLPWNFNFLYANWTL